MKKFYVLVLGLVLISAQNLLGQENEIIKEILKEKFRPESIGKASINPEYAAYKTYWKDEINVSGITNSSVSESESFIAINPTNANNMVLSYMEQSPSLDFPIYYSSDAGDTWKKSTFNVQETILKEVGRGSQIAGGGDPVFAYDGNGKLYMSFIYLFLHQSTSKLHMNMYWAESSDNGKTFSMRKDSANLIGNGGLTFMGTTDPDIGTGIYDRQWMAVDQSGGDYDGRLYISYMHMPNEEVANQRNAIFIKYKDADEDEFQTTQVRVSDFGQVQFCNVEVDGSGRVHISYVDLASSRLMHTSSTNGGQTFSKPVKVADINDTGSLGSGNESKMPHSRANSASNMAVSEDGEVYIVWSDFTNDGTLGLLSRSDDDGKTWTKPFNISSIVDTTIGGLMPLVATNPDGKVMVSWFQLNANNRGAYYVAHSTDQAKTFSHKVKVSKAYTHFANYGQRSFFGDYSKAVFGKCHSYAVWSDGRDDRGPKVYLAKVDYCKVGLQELIPVNGELAINQLYPSPANETLQLQYSTDKLGTVGIVDVMGKEWYSESVAPNSEGHLRISVDHLPAGVYTLVLNDGRFQTAKQWVKQ